MDSTMSKTKLQKRLMISNVINSIYLLLFGVMALGTWKLYQDCERLSQSLMNNTGNVSGEGVVAGYEVIGNLVGAGTILLFSAVLYLGFLISVAYALVFLAENIGGYVVYAKAKEVEGGGRTRNAIRVDTIIKCVLAVVVIAPACFLLFTEQWLFGLVLILPQGAVLFLSVTMIRMLSERKKELGQRRWDKWILQSIWGSPLASDLF